MTIREIIRDSEPKPRKPSVAYVDLCVIVDALSVAALAYFVYWVL